MSYTPPKLYSMGTVVQMNAAFTDLNGSPIDPSGGVTAEIRTPDLVVTNITGTIVKTGTGVYYALFTVVQNGLHAYRFSGAGAASQEGAFIGQSGFPS